MAADCYSDICLDEVGFRGWLCSVEECCSAADTGDSGGGGAGAPDRVTVTVPYGNASFRLTLLLSADADRPQLAPDIIFDDATFLASCSAAALEELAPALRDWRGPHDLPVLLRQLTAAYKAHLVSRLSADGALWAGYSQLLAALGPDALEPTVSADEPRPPLHVTVRLPVRVTESVTQAAVVSARRPRALLLLKATEAGGLQARLRLSPALAALAPDCRLPAPASRPLAEYVRLAGELTARQLREAADAGRARRLLVAALAAAAPSRLLDVSADCARVTLRWPGAAAELLLTGYPRRPATLCVASTAGRWRREVPLPLPEGDAGVTDMVRAVLRKAEELLKGADQDADSDESLL